MEGWWLLEVSAEPKPPLSKPPLEAPTAHARAVCSPWAFLACGMPHVISICIGYFIILVEVFPCFLTWNCLFFTLQFVVYIHVRTFRCTVFFLTALLFHCTMMSSIFPCCWTWRLLPVFHSTDKWCSEYPSIYYFCTRVLVFLYYWFLKV